MFGKEEDDDDDDAGSDQSMMGWCGVGTCDISPESSILLSSEEVVLVNSTEACRPSERFLRLETFPISPLLPPPILEGQHQRRSRGEYRCRKSETEDEFDAFDVYGNLGRFTTRN